MLKAITNLTMSSKTKHKTIVLTNIKMMTPTKHMAHAKEGILLAVSGSLTMKKFQFKNKYNNKNLLQMLKSQSVIYFWGVGGKGGIQNTCRTRISSNLLCGDLLCGGLEEISSKLV